MDSTNHLVVRAHRHSVHGGLGILPGHESAADPVEIQGEPAWATGRVVIMPTQFAFLTLALLAVTSDYGSGGIIPTLQWTPRRRILLVARVSVAILTATGIAVLLAMACAVAAYTSASGALTLNGGDALDMIEKVLIVLLAGSSLAVGLGFLLRNTAGALVSVFLLVLVLPLVLPLFGQWLTNVANVLPGAGVIHLLVGEGDDMTWGSAVRVLSMWAAGALLLGGTRLVKDDANQ